jgi:hypothetical protein
VSSSSSSSSSKLFKLSQAQAVSVIEFIKLKFKLSKLSSSSSSSLSSTTPSTNSWVEIQRGSIGVPNTGTTDAPDTTYDSLTSTFVLNKCNRFGNSGDSATSDGTSRNIDDLSGRIELTDVDEITLTRISTGQAANHQFDWESFEYKGDAGGQNEFIVRSRNTVTLSGSTRSTTATLDNTVNNIDDCIVFITGISNTGTGVNSNGITAYAYLSGTDEVTVEKGGSTDTTVVQLVVVEFTGSNWSVARGYQSESTADSGTVTLYSDVGLSTPYTISDTNNAFIAAHHSRGSTADTDEAISDNYPVSYISSTTQVTWAFDSNHASTNKQLIYVLENPDINVTRYTDNSNTAGWSNVDITTAGLTDLSKSAINGTSISSGKGTAFARGWRNYRINSLTQAQHFCHRSGNTMEHRIEIVDFSSMPSETSSSSSSSS